jgi:hypothetical protein
MWGWLIIFGVKTLVWDRYLNGLFADNSRDRMARIHGAVAGSIDSLAQRIVGSADRRLSHEAAHSLCIGLLHRIQDYACAELCTDEDVRLRVTLAVPIYPSYSDSPIALRVWCYDQPYDDRGWTELPIYGEGGLPVSGSPMAFTSGNPQVIADIHEDPSWKALKLNKRAFRSVLSIPVRAGPNGQSLAVVNIDATEPNLFKEASVLKLLPVIAPTVNLVGLVLLNRRPGQEYEFRR